MSVIPPAALGSSQTFVDPAKAIEVRLIADDLTGAADAAVAFHDRGLPVQVLLHPGHAGAGKGMIASTTESRGLPIASALEELKLAFDGALRSGAATIIKKIDSVLRGNTIAEIVWCANNLPFDLVALIPSFPEHHRILRHGRLSVGASEEEVDLFHALHDEGLHCGLIDTGGERIVSAVMDAISQGHRTLVFDAECDLDLDHAVRAIESAGRERSVLWIGSGGLTRALARRLPIRPGGGSSGARPGKVLFLVGSNHPATSAQIDLLRDAIGWHRFSAKIVPLDRSMSENAVRDSIGDIEDDVNALFVTGGDTASLVCRTYGAQALEIVGEFEPGLPQMKVVGGVLEGKLLTLKSGGFGDAGALVRLATRYAARETN